VCGSGTHGYGPGMTGSEKSSDREKGEVSEVASAEGVDPADPIAPEDATAGYPDGESGAADEGTAGPDAPPRHGRPERASKSSR
jgi:hypothetical protein